MCQIALGNRLMGPSGCAGKRSCRAIWHRSEGQGQIRPISRRINPTFSDLATRAASMRRSISPTHENASRQSASELSTCARRTKPLARSGHALRCHEWDVISMLPHAGSRCRQYDGATAEVSATSLSFRKPKFASVCPTSASWR